MDIRTLTPAYAVSPQIAPEELALIAEAGFRTVICNRPDAEVPPDFQADAIREAALAAGLKFVLNPVVHTAITPELIALQANTVEGPDQPVLAYCASGNRSTIVWALGQAATTPADELIATAAQAGYQLEGLRPQLDALYRG
ncbi:TIGR01244 family protein [Pacificitalea manganoxidans]|uniref:TIGR01244 family protein n=1 Tax=Pacificitalea manganoxidans TaxID=1411902 RepID=A0A291M0K2_9RHOB|nr:TIGR01244 family sulfur transferase [Pacificitalea manganoxidans]MAQ44898.1 TIGR01244 family phosphatase [Actibacterium sp.]OWU71977.1 hypothetical protein ATO2_01325 [Roseovarius sp. 22II1-1F6A]ATI42308.1 TIGR01244 family protein [Pacificitalea manganoxidans]MBF54515.1 TIGR01244 family phosphatase [Actibacterium sp.]MDR6307864.1 uncharacterized protein (TIGR01244 family) [Pacificitalea manganoxidans]|tara:strand:- start:188 stop:613 length:426 start_codon:yes stop_codon:yes gene_type:complete